MNIGEWSARVCQDYTKGCTYSVNYIFTLARRKTQNTVEYLGPDGEVREVERGGNLPKGVAWHVPEWFMQTMMDALWNKGVRPKEVRYEREIDLVKHHLDDMRKLALGSLYEKGE